MKRRLFTLAALVSLLLCLASVGMWVRSQFVHDYLLKALDDGHGVVCQSVDGTLTLGLPRLTPPVATSPATPWHWLVLQPKRANPIAWKWTYPDYQAWTTPVVGGGRVASFRNWILPYWLLTLATAALPALWFWRWKKQKQAARPRGFEVLPAASKPSA